MLNVCPNAKCPCNQLIFGPLITMPAANGWAEEVRLPGSYRQAKNAVGGKRIRHALEGEPPAM